MEKNSLTKILAIGATSAALLGGVLLTNNNVQASSNSVTLLTFKHNAYRYNRSGKRISKNVITKGSTYYSKGAYNINGKKYHKLDAKGNIFVKDGNLKVRVITEQVTLKHNAYTYNIHGKRVGKRVLKKGDSYFIYRTKRINGKKFYQVGGSTYIKASNCGRPFSTVKKNNNDVNNTPTTNTNTNQTTTNANVGNAVNNGAVQNSSSQGGNNTQVNVGGNTNTNKPATNQPSQGGNNTQVNVGGDTNKPQSGTNNTNQNKDTKDKPSGNSENKDKTDTPSQKELSNDNVVIPTKPGTYSKRVYFLDKNGKVLGSSTIERIVHADGSSDSRIVGKTVPIGYVVENPKILNTYPNSIVLDRLDDLPEGTTTKSIKVVDENGKLLGTATIVRTVRHNGDSTISVKNFPNGYVLVNKNALQLFPDQVVVVKAGASHNRVHKENHISLPDGYVEAVQNSNFRSNPTTTKLSNEGMTKNIFTSESKADDELHINSKNLTPAQKKEINDFALRLINEVRNQAGVDNWVYSDKAQAVSDRVAQIYEEDNMGLSTSHDQRALNQVDKEFNINSAEVMAGDPISSYEEDKIDTMTGLKHAVFNDITSMLFNITDLKHAEILISPDYTHCALSISWVKDINGVPEHTNHYIVY